MHRVTGEYLRYPGWKTFDQPGSKLLFNPVLRVPSISTAAAAVMLTVNAEEDICVHTTESYQQK